jgi:uncharacterized protein YhjY with autotransporter beta-barrel domain
VVQKIKINNQMRLLIVCFSLISSVVYADVAPVQVTTFPGTSIEIDLSSSIDNIANPDVTIANTPNLGAAVKKPDTTQVIIYTPNEGVANQSDNFVYQVINDVGEVEQATVTINIGSVATQGETPDQSYEDVISQICLQENRPGELEDICQQWDSLVAAGIEEDLREFLDKLAPAELAAQAALGNDMAQQQLENIVRRLKAVHQSLNETALSGIRFNVGGTSFAWADLDGGMGGGASADQNNNSGFGWFINGNLNTGGYEETAYEDGYTFSNGSLTTGLDYRFSNKAVVGGALGVSAMTGEFSSNGGDYEVIGGASTFYTSFFPTQRASIDLILGANYQSFSYLSRRNFGTLINECNGETSSILLTTSLAAGVEALQIGNVTWSFSVRGDYHNTSIDGYQEKNCSSAVAVEERNVEQLSSDLGTILAVAQNLSRGVLIHQFDGSWIHKYTDEPETIQVTLVADPSRPMAFKSNVPDTDYFRIGYGIQLLRPGGSVGYFQLRTTLDKENYYDVGLSLGFRAEF